MLARRQVQLAPISAVRSFHSAVPMQASALFEAASKAVNQLTNDPGNEAKLKLYALYKQATAGPNDTKKPGAFDIVGKYKWEAWTKLGSMTKAEAEQTYIDECRRLGATFDATGPSAAAAPAAAAGPSTPSTTILIKDDGPVRTVTLNRPDKRNAISFAMYMELVAAFDAAAADPAINVLVLTGAGQFFSSGNDLSNFMEGAADPQGFAEKARGILHSIVGRFINFPKILIVGVNGPAVGIATTMLPLADLVYASHTATFHAPLAALGQTPEGTSSYMFPKVMGLPRATEILVMGRKLSATEAREWGLVNDVFESSEFQAKFAEKVKLAASMPPKASAASKAILRGKMLADLNAANDEECALIKKAWLGQECQAAVMKFLTRKS